VGIQQWLGKKKNNLGRKPSVKFWLLTSTQNQVLRLSGGGGGGGAAGGGEGEGGE